MNETVEKIRLFTKRNELGEKIVKIINEKHLREDCDIEQLPEHKEFIKITEELKDKFR